MKLVTNLLVSSSFAALAGGCANLSNEPITDRQDPRGYEIIKTHTDGDATIRTMRNGCIATKTITQDEKSVIYRDVMTCPWSNGVEPQ